MKKENNKDKRINKAENRKNNQESQCNQILTLSKNQHN